MSEIKNSWSENVIVVDCAFMDALLDDFIRNFSQMIGRQLEKADLCHWLDCLLLDAQIQGGDHQTFVVFIHDKKAKGMKHMNPGLFDQLNGQAFKDQLGEFVLSCYPVEDITTTREFMVESVRAAMEGPDVKQILVVGDMLSYGEEMRKAISDTQKANENAQPPMTDKNVILYTMHSSDSKKSLKEVILGYSVMSSLGIRGDEL